MKDSENGILWTKFLERNNPITEAPALPELIMTRFRIIINTSLTNPFAILSSDVNFMGKNLFSDWYITLYVYATISSQTSLNKS